MIHSSTSVVVLNSFKYFYIVIPLNLKDWRGGCGGGGGAGGRKPLVLNNESHYAVAERYYTRIRTAMWLWVQTHFVNFLLFVLYNILLINEILKESITFEYIYANSSVAVLNCIAWCCRWSSSVREYSSGWVALPCCSWLSLSESDLLISCNLTWELVKYILGQTPLLIVLNLIEWLLIPWPLL